MAKLVNLLPLIFATLLVLLSPPVPVDALATPNFHADRQVHGHDVAAKRARQDSAPLERRCQPNPSSSLTTTSAYTPSSAPPYTPSSTPSSAPPSTSSPASPLPTTTTATSAAPSSTPSIGSGASSGKKMCLAWPNGDASYLSTFAGLPNVGYVYTWSPYLPSNTGTLGLKGMPMLWGYDQISDFQKLVVEGYADIALGMNEPNEPSQSNMSPQDGANLWLQYIDPLRSKGYKLVSPACTNDDAGLQWYQQFFAACTNCQIDAIAFHAYTTDAQAVIDYATTLYNTYKKPIWITEFADQNYSGTGGQASPSDVATFASTIANWIEATEWLEVACPFGLMYDLQGVNPANSLISNDEPTTLAHTYFG